MPLSPKLDTAGFLARDPMVWDVANAALYFSNYTSFVDRSPRYPETLYVMDLSSNNNSATQMRWKFASDLASLLNTSITALDLEEEWASSDPTQGRAQSLSVFLNLTHAALITKNQTKLLRDSFYKDYVGICSSGPCARSFANIKLQLPTMDAVRSLIPSP
jgi:hypothetical protein